MELLTGSIRAWDAAGVPLIPHSRNPYAGLVNHLRTSWLSRKTWPMQYRVAQLEALGRFLEEKEEEILEATTLDMGKVRVPQEPRAAHSPIYSCPHAGG